MEATIVCWDSRFCAFSVAGYNLASFRSGVGTHWGNIRVLWG